MTCTCVVGLQWGDEAKGKIVDILSRDHDFVVRYNGGANAGHTVVKDGKTYKLSLLPTGILSPHLKAVIGNGAGRQSGPLPGGGRPTCGPAASPSAATTSSSAIMPI